MNTKGYDREPLRLPDNTRHVGVAQHRRGAIRMLKIASLATMFVQSAAPAFAHARWFVDDTAIQLHPPIHLDSLYPAIVAGALLFVIGAVFLETSGRVPAWLHRICHQRFAMPRMLGWRLLSVAFGVILIVNSITHVFIAPNLAMGQGFLFQILTFLQIVVGAMFVIQSRLRAASVIVLVLPFICAALYSCPLTVDYVFELAGIGLGLFLVAPVLAEDERARHEMQQRRGLADRAERERLAATCLRLMFGVQLIVLAAHDKLLQPGVSLAFVDANTFVNFPALVGIPGFTNLHFVFAAGIAEVVFGALLIANIVTRPVSMILIGMFTMTGCAFGLAEMAGHIPIIAVLVILIAQGSEQPADEAKLTQWRFASMAAAGATLGLLIGVFVTSGRGDRPAVEARPTDTAGSNNAALAVPSALYGRFIAAFEHDPGHLAGELRDADQAVRDLLARGNHGGAVAKDELAYSLFNLSVRYETTYGADAASQWLRFAHLTASCTPDEVQSFRDMIASPGWKAILTSTSQPMAALLLPIVRRSAEIITTEAMDPADPKAWVNVARLAPANGANYVHTHVLASIVRIMAADAAVTGEVRIPSADIRKILAY